MPDEIEAFPLKRILATTMSEDGLYLLINVELQGGAGAWVSIPAVNASGLALAAGTAEAATATTRVLQEGQLSAFDVSWWEIAAEPGSGAICLSLTFGGGAVLRFRLGHPMPHAIYDTLQTLLTTSPPMSPKRKMN